MPHRSNDPALQRLLESVSKPETRPPPASPAAVSVGSALIGQVVGHMYGPMVITGELSPAALEALLRSGQGANGGQA